MASQEIVSILNNAQSADPNLRDPAVQQLKSAEVANLAMYLASLLTVLTNEEIPAPVRRLASLCIKNALDAKTEEGQAVKTEQWHQLDVSSKAGLKNGVLQLLQTPSEEARRGAAQVIAKVGAFELERHSWPELIPALMANATSPVESDAVNACKVSTLESIGYLCEELDPAAVSQEATNNILTAIIDNMKAGKAAQVQRSATEALLNALLFVRTNMAAEAERNMIMQVICEGTQNPDQKVRLRSFECIVRVASLYYEHLQQYMQPLFELTFSTARGEDQETGVQAIEFWCTLCEAELDYIENDGEGVPECKGYVDAALQYLLPLLLEGLSKQEEEQDEDTEMNISMSCATCLGLLAQVTGDKLVDAVMQFVTTNIRSEDWHLREAATLAFGSILDGPNPAKIQGFVQPAMPILLTALTSDPNVLVRDTSGWTISLLCRYFGSPEGPLVAGLPDLIQGLMKALDDPEARVVNNANYAIHNLAECFEDSEGETTALSPFFGPMVEKLVATADRPDWQEKGLRVTAYEAINMLITTSAEDVSPLLVQMMPLVLSRLEGTTAPATTTADKEAKEGLQANLCSLIMIITQRLEENIKPFANQIMAGLLSVLQAKNALAAGEAFMAIGAVANAVEGDFNIFLNHLIPFLYAGLQNHEEYEVCAVAVGLVGDVCRAVQGAVAPFCNNLMTLLLQNLQSPELHRLVKPPVLSAFGDIALALNGDFEPYMSVSMQMIVQASSTVIPEPDDEMIEYLNQLREGALEAYTGIIQGMKEGGKGQLLLPYAGKIAEFLQMLAADENREDSVTKVATGVIGDVADALGPAAAPYLKQPFVEKLLNDSSTIEIDETTEWAKQMVMKL